MAQKQISIETDRPINVQAAINYYNSKRGDKTKMTMESLAIDVFHGEGKSLSYGTSLLSRFNTGATIDSCKIIHCIRISRITGYPLCELLENYID